VVCKDNRHVVQSRQPKGCIAQKERMMSVGEIRLKLVNRSSHQARDRQPNGKIAAIEVLNGWDAHDISFVVRHVGKSRSDDKDPVPLPAQRLTEPLDGTRHASRVRSVRIGHHHDVHDTYW
jgi:hypothetical protein